MSAKQTEHSKTIYVVYMCDHAYVLAAAMRAHGMPAEVLDPSDDATLAAGLAQGKGRECLPCFTAIGDILRRARQPDFVPERAALLVPTTGGPCRFGQYRALIRDILDRERLGAIEIISPSAANSYQDFGANSAGLRLLAWQGIIAVDLLQKLLHEYRPYERDRGQADMIYREGLQQIIRATEAGHPRRLLQAMRWVAGQFQNLPIDRRDRRPLIGMVGEIYLRFNTFANQQIIRSVEAAGGEVVLATMMEWFYFTNWDFMEIARASKRHGDFLSTLLVDRYQRHLEHKLLKPVEHLLTYPHETPIARIIDNVRPYFQTTMGADTEAVLSMGKAIDLARLGLSGIINVMPFSCMAGIITAGMAPRIRADLANVPWLDVIYDAQGGTNISTRLEAFMYQATQYHNRRYNECIPNPIVASKGIATSRPTA
jgi:predicted nucleotide-binding protein (sugar kinase/HSP70/actin superfamily)